MADNSYVPPKVWQWHPKDDNFFAKINRPVSGATHERSLPRGESPFQLYTTATPNGVKVTVMLEELLAMGIDGVEYDTHPIAVMEGEQFGSDFVELNPNSKVPVLLDCSGEKPISLFESGAILLYLAEKFNALIPETPAEKARCLSWLFWQMASSPHLGSFGHFYVYANEKVEYAIDRYAMEAKRLLDVIDKHLADHEYAVGDSYTIADIAIAPWFGGLARSELYADGGQFLDVQSYTHLQRWTNNVCNRPAYIRGVQKLT